MLRGQTVAITTDAWTSKANTSFTGLHVSWMDPSFCLHNLSLGISAFEGKHTGDRILEDIVENLKKYDISMNQVHLKRES
jgi:hypothetical protein